MPEPQANGMRRRRDPSEEATTTATDKVVETVKAVEDKASQTLLILWDELEDWRRDNAFILGGYRRTSNSYAASLASLLHLHNESVNIWSHLVGAVGFTATGAYFLQAVVRPRVAEAYGGDVLAFACFFAGAFLCLGMSATFHALSNHSPAVAKWGNKLDYTGIVFLIVGSYVPALYYGFRCHPALLELYLSMICILGLGCLAVSWVDHFRSPAWRPYRALMFVGLGLSGVVPVVHAVSEDGFAALDERMGLRWVLLQGGMYIFGAFIYAARWPERSFPGKFDIWCSSHQIFHIFVLLAAASHMYGMIKAFDFRHSPLGSVQC
ncbi:hypothetical protein PspLS_02264 [Pyricularia sp. CBS 133598]|nr:hypothetical protein PspLS_02264 [Pyricularia sp. CBS 133598]